MKKFPAFQDGGENTVTDLQSGTFAPSGGCKRNYSTRGGGRPQVAGS